MAQQVDCSVPGEGTDPEYDAPRLERLGSLSELTQGGGLLPDDSFGGAGDVGSL